MHLNKIPTDSMHASLRSSGIKHPFNLDKHRRTQPLGRTFFSFFFFFYKPLCRGLTFNKFAARELLCQVRNPDPKGDRLRMVQHQGPHETGVMGEGAATFLAARPCPRTKDSPHRTPVPTCSRLRCAAPRRGGFCKCGNSFQGRGWSRRGKVEYELGATHKLLPNSHCPRHCPGKFFRFWSQYYFISFLFLTKRTFITYKISSQETQQHFNGHSRTW